MSNPITFAMSNRVDVTQLGPYLMVPGVLLCLLDSGGRLIQSNSNWLDILGYSEDELSAMTILDLLHPADVDKTLGDERWLEGSAVPGGFINRCIHKDGSYRWLRWHTHRQTDARLTYAVAIDVTTTSDSEGLAQDIPSQSFRQAADQILFEANPNPMWVYDRDSLRFLEVNDAAIEHYGYTRGEFLSMTLLEIRPEADRDAVRESVARYPVKDPVNLWTHLLKNGQSIQVEVLVRNIEYRGYRARLATIKDVTEQQRARAMLQRNNAVLEQRVAERTKELVDANTELEAFCFSVSHDLRAPLRSIDGFSHSVLKHYGAVLGEDGKADLERVRRASQKMSELIDALLGLTRLTRQELRLQTIDISSMARQINDEIRADHPERTVECRIQDGLEAVADPRLMHLLLQNLFANAWKFTSNVAVAEIVFEARLTGSELVYSVRDNGAGFDMAYADKLFQPFQRLHHASEFPGNGVGLATVNRIVNRHGGRTFAHGLINNGATIYFTLGTTGS